MFAFHHIALSVSDEERSRIFYEMFDFKPIRRWAAEDGSLSILHLKNDNAVLELFCYRAAQSLPPSSQSLKSDLPIIGTKHFGMNVENIREVYERLRSNGVQMASEVTMGRTGIEYFFVRDPDGILFEVVHESGGYNF